MTKDEIQKKLFLIIRDDLGIDYEIDINKSLLQTSVLDSMDWISFLTIVEEKFDLEIPTKDADKYQIGIMSNLINYLEERAID